MLARGKESNPMFAAIVTAGHNKKGLILLALAALALINVASSLVTDFWNLLVLRLLAGVARGFPERRSDRDEGYMAGTR